MRERSGLTQAELAGHVGTKQRAVKLEAGGQRLNSAIWQSTELLNCHAALAIIERKSA